MKEIAFKLKADGSEVNKTLKEVTEEIEDLKKKLEGTEIGSKKFKELAGALQDAQSQVKGLEKQFEGLEPEKQVEAFAKLGEGIAGGFAAATGAMALFGTENQRIEELMVKTQAAVAIAMGARSVAEGLVQGQIAKRLLLDKLATVQTFALTGATAAYNLVVGTTTGVLKVLRIAMISTGIGALIVGLGLLIANFDKVSEYIMNAVDSFMEFAKPVKEFLQSLGIIDTEEEKLLKAQADRSKKRLEQFEKEGLARQRAIDLAKAEGKSNEVVGKMEMDLLYDRFEAYRRYVADRIKAGEKITQEESDKLNELRQNLKVRQAELSTAARKEAEDEAKKEKDKREKRQKEYADYLKMLNEQLLNARIEAIGDAQAREIAQENKNHQDKLAQIKGNSELELALRAQLIANNQTKIAEINKKYADEAAEKANKENLDRIQRYFDDQLALEEALIIQKRLKGEETFAEEAELALIKRDQELSAQDLTNGQKLLIEEKYNEALADIQQRRADRELQIEQQKSDAMIGVIGSTQNIISSLTELGIANGKKTEKAQKALAIAMLAIETAKAIATTVANAATAASAGGPAAPFLLVGYIAAGLATVLGAVASASKLLGKSGPDVSSSAPAARIANGVQPSGTQQTDNSPRVRLDREFNVKATVVETEMTNTQNRVSSIQETATI